VFVSNSEFRDNSLYYKELKSDAVYHVFASYEVRPDGNNIVCEYRHWTSPGLVDRQLSRIC
jgi:hypothetical protein